MARRSQRPDAPDRFADDDYPVYYLDLEDRHSTAIARGLYRTYPGEWLTLHVGEPDTATGRTPVRVLSHDKLGFRNERMVWEYRRRHPDAPVQMLCTSMGVGRPGGW